MQKKYLKKGNGEFIGFTVVTLLIVTLFIPICTIIQLYTGLYDVNKMLMSSSRAAAICTNMEDAKKQSKLVAESTATNSNINQIDTDVNYAEGYSKWESGTCIVVTVKAKLKTMGTLFPDREFVKSIPVTIENLDGLTGSNCQEQVFNYLKQNGFTDEAACGVLGNIEQESGFDSTKLQGNGPAAGLFQWENYKTKSGRWKNLDQFAQARGKTWDNLACQLDFMIYELSGGESTATSKLQHMYPNGINGFKQETDIEKATKNFEESYERAGIPVMSARYAAAHKYYNQFHK